MDQLDIELRLVGDYGLRNKKELWRYKSLLSRIRGIARSLLAETEEYRLNRQREYMVKMTRLGLLEENGSIDDILDLDIKDLLEKGEAWLEDSHMASRIAQRQAHKKQT